MYDRTSTDLNCCVQIGKNEHLFRTTSKLEGESDPDEKCFNFCFCFVH